MGRKVISIILGVITGFVIVFIGDATSHKIYPATTDSMEPSAIESYIQNSPGYVMVVMVLFWLLSAFFGGMVAGRINRPGWKQSAIITGSILMAAAILNLAMIKHPAWMWIVTLAGYLPSALLGAYLVKGNQIPKRETGI